MGNRFAKGRPRVEKLINDHPLYNIWCCIKQRCYNKKHSAYKYYGARGVVMCSRWLNDFFAFVSDVGERPSQQHTIDRHPNKNGNYEPSNFRWATNIQQARNRNRRFSITPYN